ncbi:hypothetical protein N7456_003687 [Penicillium angulare]|uniref:Aminoglycoside phosphotransferase domain-containing protein n=1 Tax=Penicillium angulare TaxID=116970 RepID=A0A9W9KIZ6_9EURO|nr:hypothetical protein N7456_003687 [Penicillium angulare]
MPKTLPLLRKEITYSTAATEEVNILHKLQYVQKRIDFFTLLYTNTDWIEETVAHHLGLSTSQCEVVGVKDWLHGSFNVCIPVDIKGEKFNRVLIRFPLPYRVGESVCPGNSDEKLRCEAGTYAWMQDNCPDVPIPRLHGFGLSSGQASTHIENLSFLNRALHHLRRFFLGVLGYPVPTKYIPHAQHVEKGGRDLNSGYLLLECIQNGQMLSTTWQERHRNPTYRQTFFRDLAKIMLSLTSVPLPRIGSFQIDEKGILRLTNRPLTSEIHNLENENVPSEIPRDFTYCTVDSYVMDLLRVHSNRVRHQPNAINNIPDCQYQVTTLAAMQTIIPSMFARKFCRGPFAFSLTDLHQSNIFVDDNWNITSLIDLEWACPRPVELLRTPTWLTNEACDQLALEENAEIYDEVRMEYLSIMAEEENKISLSCESKNRAGPKLSEILEENWQSGTFWYSLALDSPTGIFWIFHRQLKPRFTKGFENFNDDGLQEALCCFWSKDLVRISIDKMKHREQYDSQLKELFGVTDEQEDHDEAVVVKEEVNDESSGATSQDKITVVVENADEPEPKNPGPEIAIVDLQDRD